MSTAARRRFLLETEEILQGDFALGELNLLLVFQVNCPGCFLHSLPLAERLHGRFAARGLRVLGLSTAFEDFAVNTAGNTRLLLQEGTLVGTTAAYLGSRGISKREFGISYPVAFDRVAPVGGPGDSQPCGQSFARNGLEGTPTWLLLDRESGILARQFGHPSEPELVQWLERRLGG